MVKDLESHNISEIPKLSDFKGRILIINKVDFDNTQFGEIAFLTLDNSDMVRVSNSVVLKQLHQYKEQLPLRVFVTTRKSSMGREYLFLDSPKNAKAVKEK